MSNIELTNPVTGERIVFREGMGNPEAEVLGFDFYIRPGGGVYVPHLHLEQTETIRISRGRVLCGFGPTAREAGPGEVVTFAPGEGHVLHCVGDEELCAYVEFRPAGKAESFLRNYFGMCSDGKCDAKGDLPILQIATFMPPHGTWRADIPLFAQRILFTILRPFGWLFGYRGGYPKYMANP